MLGPVDGGSPNGKHDVLAMLDGTRVANNIARLLVAATAFALAWVCLDGVGPSAGLAALAFGATAMGFVAWQRIAPGAEGRLLMETGLYAGAVLVLVTA